MSKPVSQKMERILWVDAFCADGFFTRDPPPPIVIDSMGFVVEETEEHVVLARDRYGEYYRSTVAIPKACIRSRSTLRWD